MVETKAERKARKKKELEKENLRIIESKRSKIFKQTESPFTDASFLAPTTAEGDALFNHLPHRIIEVYNEKDEMMTPTIGELTDLEMNLTLNYYTFESYVGDPKSAERILGYYTDLSSQVVKSKKLLFLKIQQALHMNQSNHTALKERFELLSNWERLIQAILGAAKIILDEFCSKGYKLATTQNVVDISDTNLEQTNVALNTSLLIKRPCPSDSGFDTSKCHIDIPISGPDVVMNKNGIETLSNTSVLDMNNVILVKSNSDPEEETTVIPVSIVNDFYKRKDLDVYKIEFKPEIQSWDVEEFIFNFQNMLISLTHQQKVLAFAYLAKSADTTTTQYAHIARFIYRDIDKNIYASWSAIKKFLLMFYRTDICRTNASTGYEAMRTWFPAYNTRATLDEFNEKYIWYLERLDRNYIQSNYNEVVNYLSMLPDAISDELKKTFLVSRLMNKAVSDTSQDLSRSIILGGRDIGNLSAGKNDFYLLEVMKAAAQAYVIFKIGTSTVSNTRLAVVRTSSKNPERPRKIRNYEVCKIHLKLQGKKFYHPTDDCLLLNTLGETKEEDDNTARPMKHRKVIDNKDISDEEEVEEETECDSVNPAAVLKRMGVDRVAGKNKSSAYVKTNSNKFLKRYSDNLVKPIFSKSDSVYPVQLIHPISKLENTIDTLFDSGCNCNVISEQLVRNLQIPYESVSVDCKAFNGSKIQTLGLTIPIEVMLAGSIVKSKFLIIQDDCSGNVSLLTIGNPSFQGLGVAIKFPVQPSVNLRFAEDVKTIYTRKLLGNRRKFKQIRSLSRNLLGVTQNRRSFDLNKNIVDDSQLLSNNSAGGRRSRQRLLTVFSIRKKLGGYKEISSKSGRYVRGILSNRDYLNTEQENRSLSTNEIADLPLNDNSENISDILSKRCQRVESVLSEPSDSLEVITVDASLDITHVKDHIDSMEDTQLREPLVANLMELIKINNAETISTIENPCFIQVPSAMNVRICHKEGTLPAFDPQYPIVDSSMSAGDEFLTTMLNQGKVINSPKDEVAEFNIPVLINVQLEADLITVKKYRLCHDMRRMNIGIIGDNYALPTSDQIFAHCDGDLFTELDCESAFYQLRIHPDDQHKLSFTWRGKRYRCVGAPFGLSFVSATFQRVIDEVYPPSEFPFLMKYIDNLVIVSKGITHAEHALLVEKVIRRATEVKLRLSEKKCVLMKRSIETLGMQLSDSKLSIAPTKQRAIAEWVMPTSWAELEHVVGFSLFVRKFVYRFSDVMKPLYDLLTVGRRKVNNRAPRFYTTPEAVKAFELLKERLTKPITLRILDPNKKICIATDASKIAMCVVIYQPEAEEGPNAENVIDFYTRSFKGYECNYPPFKLEALALHDGIMFFADHLYQKKFTVYTDQKALTHMFNSINTNRTLANWLFDLLHFDFEVYHIPGIDNQAADTGSRIPRALSRLDSFEEFIKTLQSAELAGSFRSIASAHFNSSELGGEGDSIGKTCDGIACSLRKVKLTTLDEAEAQFRMIESIHKQGHFGIQAVRNRMEALGHSWPKMIDQIKTIVGSCNACQMWNYSRKKVFHPLRGINTKWPMDHLQMDLITSITPNKHYKYLLVVVDVFTSYTFLRPLPNKETDTIANALFGIFADFGTPLILQNDGEPAMVGKVLKHMKDSLGIATREITPYSSHSNGKVENTIRTVTEMLNKLLGEVGTDAWAVVPICQMFINTKIIDHLKISKFALMFNRDNHLFTKDHVLNPNFEMDVNLQDPVFMEAWKKYLQDIKTNLLPFMRYSMNSQQIKYLAQFHELHSINEDPISVGTIVMLKDLTRTQKSHPPYIGDFTVKSVDTRQCYELLDNKTGEIYRYHVPRQHLKVMKYALPNNPLGLRYAFVDYIVGEQIDEYGVNKYIVRWTGHNADADSCVAISDITDPAINYK